MPILPIIPRGQTFSSISGATTGVPGTDYYCTAALDLTLPAAGTAGDRIKVYRADGGGDVGILTTGAETVHFRGVDEASDSAQLMLYIDGDYLEFIDNGTQWQVWDDGLIPHFCDVTRNATQPINHDTTTKIAFDNIDKDQGGIADVSTNDRVDLKRAGWYSFAFSGLMSIDDGEKNQNALYLNGGLHRLNRTYSSEASGLGYVLASGCGYFSAGDYLELFIYHTQGAQQDTKTTEHGKQRLMISEVR